MCVHNVMCTHIITKLTVCLARRHVAQSEEGLHQVEGVYIYIYIYLSIYLSIYLYLSLSIYIYIYIKGCQGHPVRRSGPARHRGRQPLRAGRLCWDFTTISPTITSTKPIIFKIHI